MIQVVNADAFIARIRAHIKKAADDKFREQVLIRFGDLVYHSPQWSGDFASNWEMSKDGGSTYLKWGNKQAAYKEQTPHKAGDPEAPRHALAHARLLPISFRDKIFFTNATPLKFSDVGVKREGTDKWRYIRPENLIDGRVALASWLKQRYPT